MRMVLPLYTFAPPAWPCRGLAFPGFWGWTLATSVHYTAGKKEQQNPSNPPFELPEASVPPFPHSSQEPSNPLAADSLLLASPLRGETHPLPDL